MKDAGGNDSSGTSEASSSPPKDFVVVEEQKEEQQHKETGARPKTAQRQNPFSFRKKSQSRHKRAGSTASNIDDPLRAVDPNESRVEEL